MKKLILIMLIATLAIGINARTITIVELNTPTINIGGVELKAGDTFEHTKNIKWVSNRQAMKVRTDDNRVLVVSPELFAKYKAKEFSQFLTTIEATATRGNGYTPFTEAEHRKAFEGAYVLLDSLTFEVGWRVDESSYFYITPSLTPGLKVRLPYEDGKVTISRDLLQVLPRDTDLVTLAVHYYESNPLEDTTITNSMEVIIVPEKL